MTPTLVPADGPLDPPSSRPRAGVLRGRVFAYSFIPADGMVRLDLPLAVTAGPDTLLRWAFYADGAEAALAPHAALAISVDVRFEDGTRLSEIPRLVDRYGFALDAAAQFGARWSMPEQWNEDAVMLAAAGARTGVVEVVLGAPGLSGEAAVTGFVEVVVEESPLVEMPTIDRIDTRRGSHAGDRYSRGNTIPAAALPHGFVFLTPATDASNERWPYRPFLHDDPAGRRLEAVQFSHQPSPWIGDRGVLQLMPFRGEPVSARERRRRWIVPGTEVARPHRYAATLDDGTELEVIPTQHGGVFRAQAAGPIGFVLDALTDDGGLELRSDGFDGWIAAGDPAWGNAPRTYFAGSVWAGDAGVPEDAERSSVAGFIRGVDEIEVRIALSFISPEIARRTLADELGQASIDELRTRAAAAWEPLLTRVLPAPLPADERAVRGLHDAELRANVASALYRMHLYPNTMSEDTPHGRRYADPFGTSGVRSGELMVNNGYWDTYRTVWPALTLLDPDHAGDLVDGLVEQFRAGGWMPRWSAPGYVNSMVGTSSDQIFADAERWGVRLDTEAAFASAVRNALEPSRDPRWGRAGLGRGRFRGWISSAVHEGLSWSLENAIGDAAIARWAARMSRAPGDAYDAHARYLANRSRAYRTLFDAQSGFFRGRDDSGAFSSGPFEARAWGGDYVETNAWGMSVSPVHDGAGLASLYGSPAALGDHLDALFAEPETADPAFAGWYGTVIHEQREARGVRAGMCAISNQPAHHIPYMYAHTDRPWLAGARVRDLAGRLFGGTAIAQGFPGDEDNGEMSAWWLWAALGLYPLELASGMLRIGDPLLDDVTVVRAGGSRLRVQATGEGAYVVAIRLNGVPLAVPDLPVEALSGDVDLEIVRGEDPTASQLWRTEAAVVPEYYPDLTATARCAGAEALIDDGDPAGDEGVVLAPADQVVFELAAAARVTDITLTALTRTSSTAISLTADGKPLELLGETLLEPDRTTPLRVRESVRARVVTLHAHAPVTLRQVELFELEA